MGNFLPSKLVIATRKSRLAMWQAEHVKKRILSLYPRCDITLLGLTTTGDQILDRSLSKIGGKGLFVKELEAAIAEGRADLAVHSLKDVPQVLPDGFELAVVLEREDARDAFVSNRFDGLAAMHAGAIVGTSSLRRQSNIASRYPHLVVRPLRGNLDTRLRKLDEGEFDAIILAAAGLKRLGWGERIRQLLSTEDLVPAPGQGALAIETLSGREDLRAWLAPLNHLETERAVRAERAVAASLGGSCQLPLAAYAHMTNGRLHVCASVTSPDGTRCERAEASGSPDDPEALGATVVQALRQQGVADILALCHAG